MIKKEEIRLGDICSEVRISSHTPLEDGFDKYIALEHLDSGSLKINRWGSISADNPTFTRVFKKGNLLFGKRRPYLKKLAIADFDGVCSGDIIVIDAVESKIDLNILPFYLQSNKVWEWAVKTSSGSLSPRTKFKTLSELKIEIPKKCDQPRVSKLLWAIENNIRERSKVDITAQQLIKSTLQEYCGFLAKYKSTDNIKSRVPKGWKLVQLKDVLTRAIRPIIMEDNSVYQTVVARRGFGGIEERDKLKGIEISVKSQFEIQTDDFLISKRQIVHGGCGVVPSNLSGAIVSNEYDVFKADNGMHLDFFKWLVRTPRMRNYFFINSVGIHIEKMLFKTDDWLNMPLILPTEDYQLKVSKAIISITNQRTALAENMKAELALQQSLVL